MIDLLHQLDVECGAVTEDKVCFGCPIEFENVPMGWLKVRSGIGRPTESLFVDGWIRFVYVGVICRLYLDRKVLKGLKDLYTPTPIELVHERSRKDPFARAMA